MKLTKYFLPLAALGLMASCSNDNIDAPVGPSVGANGDMFMTMNIGMASAFGSRTTTPNQGYEVGKDYENAISSALIIFAKQSQKGYEIVFTSGETGIPSSDIVGDPSYNGAGTGHEDNPSGVEPDPSHTNSYKASFKFERSTLKAALTEPVEDGEKADHGDNATKYAFTIFVVANPTSEMITAAKAGADVQQVFEKANNDGQYWTGNEFLMSSAAPAIRTIYSDEIAEGLCTTKAEALNLGTVYVQRAMSRFDLALDNNHVEFEGEGDANAEGTGASTLNGINIKFDAVAMVNMAKSANLFKVMAKSQTALGELTMSFADERESTYADNWVFSPIQTAYFNPLFTGLTGDAKDGYKGESVALKSFFEENADFQPLAEIKIEDNAFEHENHTTGVGNYKIWRYCMENTNPDDVKYQKYGNSTGVIFRAIITETKPEESVDPAPEALIPTEYAQDDTKKEGEAIYAYNNVILGTATKLKAYATNSKGSNDAGVYEAVRNIYAAAVLDAVEKNKKLEGDEGNQKWDGEWTDNTGWKLDKDGKVVFPADSRLSDLDSYLVEQGFNIYRPTEVDNKPVYYCYYIYMNRHNDNNANTQMGIMEFATVRNNVYKLSVNKILRLGHPGNPDDDPEDPKPDDPNEKDEFWLEVQCEILPWEVRVNNIEF